MSDYAGKRSRAASSDEPVGATAGPVPGKATLREQLHGAGASAPVQRSAASSTPVEPMPQAARPTIHDLFGGHIQRRAAGGDAGEQDTGAVHASAQRGIATAASSLPHADAIQRAFGHHDISAVQAHTGPDAGASAREMGAQAYATGNHVVLGAGTDLHTVAHEAAHVVQQRAGVQLAGGVGEVNDPYERHADAVADLVVRGQSAQTVLDDLAPTGGGAGAAVQRYIPHNLGGTVDPGAYDARAGEQSRGSIGFNSSNHAWAEVTTATGAVKRFELQSARGEAHAEERLLGQVFAEYPDIQRNKPDPADASQTRITQVYTEREPCSDANADFARRGRAATSSNCHAYLTLVLHPQVPVSFSVPNNPGAHALFVDHQRVQYTEEIATGARRLMLAEARNATNLTSYQEPIRRKCHELTRGNWGRDYRRDLEVYNTLLEQFRTTCQGPIAMNVANVGQLETRLRAAFEGGAHPAGSDPVQAAMQAAYDVEHARAQQALAELAAEDGGAGGDDGGRGTKRRDRDDAPGGGGGSTTGGGPGGGGAETHKRPRLTSTGGGNDAAAS